jgi:hypothetical protein
LKKLILVVVVVAGIAFPTAASSHSGHGKGHHKAGTAQARKACRAERQADPAAFRAKYANKNGKRAMRRCVRQRRRAARQTCRAERRADPAAFKAKYANKKGKRAFRRCVRQHAG